MSLYEKCIAKLITGKKLNFPLVFITKSSFLVPKNIRQNSMHYFIMKTPNKQELQQITFNHLWDIEFKKCLSLYEKVTPKPYSFLVIDATLASCNTLFFRKIFSKEYENYSLQLMIRLEMKNYNVTLIEKQQIYQHYHPDKMMNMNILQVRKYCLLIKNK